MLPDEVGGEITPEADALLNCIDPYRYSLRGSYPMPKFMLNATGDEFFVPDTAEFYFHDLEGEAHQSFVPNVGHGMGDLNPDELISDPDNPVAMEIAWIMSITQNKPLPQFTYSFEEDGSIRVEVNTDYLPQRVRLWQAEQPEEGVRDFRNYKLPANSWTSTVLTSKSPGVYVAPAPVPTPGHYAAFFVQMQFPNQAEMTFLLDYLGYETPLFTFSTGVRVVPEAYPEFTGYLANVEKPESVPFTEDELPVIVTYGTPYEMGYYYGQLLADDINAFIPAYLEAWKTETGLDDTYLADTWNQAAATMDERILDEIEGIAAEETVSVSLTQLQYAHAAMMYESPSVWTGATTSVYRELSLGTDAAQAVSINGPAARDLHQYQCAVMYIPDKGVPHIVFTYAGLTIGQFVTNLGGISAMEIVDPAAIATGQSNALCLLRSLVYDTLNLRDGVDIVKGSLPGYASSVVLGDGRYELRSARIRTDGLGNFEERYDLASDFGATNCGIIYATVPLFESALQTQIAGYVPPGATVDNLRTIAGSAPSAEAGFNLLNLVVDNSEEAMEIWLSTASGLTDAGYPDNKIDAQNLLP